MLIPSLGGEQLAQAASLSRRVNANSQLLPMAKLTKPKLIKKGEC